MTRLYSPMARPTSCSPGCAQDAGALELAPSDQDGFWSLTRFEDIVPVNKGWEEFSSARRGSFMTEGGIVPEEMASLVFNMMDPPEHDRHRGILQKVFTARAIAERAADVRATINRPDRRGDRAGDCDLVRDIAVELPLTVTANMLGVPLEDREQLFAWTNKFADTSPRSGGEAPGDGRARGVLSAEAHRQAPRAPRATTCSHVCWYAELDGERLNDDRGDRAFHPADDWAATRPPVTRSRAGSGADRASRREWRSSAATPR